MRDEIVKMAPERLEWIALASTFATPDDSDDATHKPKSVIAGTRLTATLSEELENSWRITDGEIDGALLLREIHSLDKAHWMLLPKMSVAPTATESLVALTVDRLLAGRWSFGEAANPWTLDLRFASDGKTAGQAGPQHRFWNLANGRLSLFTKDHRLSWISDLVTVQNGKLRLAGFRMLDKHVSGQRFLTELPAEADVNNFTAATSPVTEPALRETTSDEPGASSGQEIIKLIVWDLDETFWHGTLTEGGINAIEANVKFVKEMSARGIVNSICSKNEFDSVKAELERLGLWEYFIFPKIAFAPKGMLIKEIIDAAQLRAPSVLFIDDNRMNLNEALHYNPGLQVAEPDAIAKLLDDPRCKGKPDPELKRLAHYKVLEKKTTDQASAGNDNLNFLHQSDVRVSFHYNVMEEFPRIHDLVNRTNQLNFTKNRWPENLDAARIVFQEELDRQFNSHCGYVKVADRYGEYGIVGFFLVSQKVCQHFLFSCRTLNMGIEQFVWQKLGRPRLQIVGDVVAKLGANPEWITVVDDADKHLAYSGIRKKICVRGACDLAMMTHYLRTRFETVEEFNYPYKHWAINPVARAVVVYEETQKPEGHLLLQKLQAVYPPDRFISDINTGTSDIYVLSFAAEISVGMYRSRSTGMILPFAGNYIRKAEFKTVSYGKIAAKAEPVGLGAETWKFLQDEFMFIGLDRLKYDVVATKPGTDRNRWFRDIALDQKLFAADVETIFKKLRGKTVIVLMLNTLLGKGLLRLNWAKINDIVRPLALDYGVHTIEINDYVKTRSDLSSPEGDGSHFKREIYHQLTDRVIEIIAQDEEAKEPAELVNA